MSKPKDHLFVSYNTDDACNLAESLRQHLLQFDIHAWVYSRDKTLGGDMWPEIEARLAQAEVVLWLQSTGTLSSRGQKEELELLAKIGDGKVVPIIIPPATYDELPERLRKTNGLRLDAHHVQLAAQEIAEMFFPKLLGRYYTASRWRYPLPGMWLRVVKIDRWIVRDIQRGDLMYFRKISPLGLFECYAPRYGDLYWLYPGHLAPAKPREISSAPMVPEKYSVIGMLNCEREGYQKVYARS